MTKEDEKLLERVQQFISSVKIVHEECVDEVYMIKLEADFLLEKFHEFRERSRS